MKGEASENSTFSPLVRCVRFLLVKIETEELTQEIWWFLFVDTPEAKPFEGSNAIKAPRFVAGPAQAIKYHLAALKFCYE